MITKNDIRQLWRMERIAFEAGIYDIYGQVRDADIKALYDNIRKTIPVIDKALSDITPEHINLIQNIYLDQQNGSDIVASSIKNNFFAGHYLMESEYMKANYGINVVDIAQQRIEEANRREQSTREQRTPYRGEDR